MDLAVKIERSVSVPSGVSKRIVFAFAAQRRVQ
jgi:hypothetical protein